MTVKEKELALAYALGNALTYQDHGSVKLGTICPEWEKYYIAGFVSEKGNNSWHIGYNGPLGKESYHVMILTIREGLTIAHMVHIIMQALSCHMAEIKEKE